MWIWKDKIRSTKYPRKIRKWTCCQRNRVSLPSGSTLGTLSARHRSTKSGGAHLLWPHPGTATVCPSFMKTVEMLPSVHQGSESMSWLCSVGVFVKGIHRNELSLIKSQSSKTESSGTVACSAKGLPVLKPVKHRIQIQQCFDLDYKIANVKTSWK